MRNAQTDFAYYLLLKTSERNHMGRVRPQIKVSPADPTLHHRDMVGNGNAMFAKLNDKFRAACEKAGVQPTRRQAAKWNKGFGSAWKNRNN